MTANDASEIGGNYRNLGPQNCIPELLFGPSTVYLNYFQRFWIIFEAQKTWLLNPHLIVKWSSRPLIRFSPPHHPQPKIKCCPSLRRDGTTFPSSPPWHSPKLETKWSPSPLECPDRTNVDPQISVWRGDDLFWGKGGKQTERFQTGDVMEKTIRVEYPQGKKNCASNSSCLYIPFAHFRFTLGCVAYGLMPHLLKPRVESDTRRYTIIGVKRRKKNWNSTIFTKRTCP